MAKKGGEREGEGKTKEEEREKGREERRERGQQNWREKKAWYSSLMSGKNIKPSLSPFLLIFLLSSLFPFLIFLPIFVFSSLSLLFLLFPYQSLVRQIENFLVKIAETRRFCAHYFWEHTSLRLNYENFTYFPFKLLFWCLYNTYFHVFYYINRDMIVSFCHIQSTNRFQN